MWYQIICSTGVRLTRWFKDACQLSWIEVCETF